MTWDPVPGAIRYAFIVGVAGAPVPPLSALISGQAPGFALLGIPARFTGAALIGSAAGEERQFGLVAYMADGSSAPVTNLQFMPARSAPRDRQYHPLLPPSLPPAPRSGPLAQPTTLAGEPERRPSPLAPLQGGDPRDNAARFGAGTPMIAPSTAAGAESAHAAQGGSSDLPMQQYRIGRDGLSVTWDAVPGAMRYGLVVGVAGVQPPALETIMRGGSGQFSVLGIPARFTGATLMGPAEDESRQVCLIAWRSDGTMVPVQTARFGSMRAAPRDRDYHPLASPGLSPASGVAMPPASPAPAAFAAPPPTATPQRRQTAEEAFAAMMAARQAGLPLPPATPAVQQTPPPAAADPWDLLTSPSAAADPARWMPRPAEPESVQQPAPPVAEPVPSADPWDLLGPPSEQAGDEEREEPAPTSTLSLPDPWDVLDAAAHAEEHAAKKSEHELPTWLPAEPPAAQRELTPEVPVAPEPEPPPATEEAAAPSPVIGGEAVTAAEEALPLIARADTPVAPSDVQHGVAEVAGHDARPVIAERAPEPASEAAPPHQAVMASAEAARGTKGPPAATPPVPDRAEPAVPAPSLAAEPVVETEPTAHMPAAADRDTSVEERVAQSDEGEQLAADIAPAPVGAGQVESPVPPPVAPAEPALDGVELTLASEREVQPQRAAAAPPDVAAPSSEPPSQGALPTAPARPTPPREEAEVVERPPEQAPAIHAPPVEESVSLAAELERSPLAERERSAPAAGDALQPAAAAVPQEESLEAVSPAPAPPAEPRAAPVVGDHAAPPPAPAHFPQESQGLARSAGVEEAVRSLEVETDERMAAPAVAPPIPVAAEQQMPMPEVAPPPAQPPAPPVTSDDVWLTEEPPSPPAPEPPPAGTPSQAAEPVKVVPLDTGPLPAALVALLEEAELYLLPQWADYAEVARLLDRVEQEVPNHVRMHELRERLREAQQGGGTQDVTPLLREAEECLARKDYWDAVDLYEQALAKQPENADARSGAERARMLARWSAQWTGAAGDAERLQTLGDEYAGAAPDLAHQAYAAAFAATPTVQALQGLLVSLVRSNRGVEVVAAAREGVTTLREAGDLLVGADELGRALEMLARCGDPGLPEAEAERMIAVFSRSLAADTV